MSKIDTVIEEIQNYLAGGDHSANPQIRKAAEFYARASHEINRQLAECQSLIDNGLLIDAQNISNSMTPSLLERGLKLRAALPPEQFNTFCELCRMYNYPVPAVIDPVTLAALRDGKNGQAMDNLILRWRKIARTHNTAAKVKLLREILATQPAGEKMWRSNLMNIEQQWITELMAEADKALAAGDGNKLIAYHQALTDPALLAPPSAAVLKKFEGLIQATHQQAFDQQLENKRNAIFSAYSMADDAAAKALLREYDAMQTDPLYRNDADAERAVDEVRTFVADREAQRKLEQEFKRQNTALIQLLDDHGDFSAIETLYESLRRMDLPIDERLSIRVKNRREEYQAEMHRKHTRKCVYSIMTVILLLILLGGGFFFLQSYRTYRSYVDEMNSLMEQKNYAGIIDLHKTIEEKSPHLLRFGHLSGLKAEAEKKIADQQELHTRIADLCQAAEAEWEKADKSMETMRFYNSKIQELKNDELTAELNKRCDSIAQKTQQMELDYKEQLEQEFADRIEPSLNELKTCVRQLSDTADLVKIQSRIDRAMQAAEKCLQSPGEVAPEFVQSYKDSLESIRQKINIDLPRFAKRQEVLRMLYTPSDSTEYLKALAALPTTLPELAGNAWAEAVKDVDLTRSLINAVKIHHTPILSRRDLEDRIKALNITNLEQNTIIADTRRMIPDDQQMLNTLSKKIIELQKLQNDSDYYELILLDSRNNKYCFYAGEEPVISRRQLNNELLSILIKVKNSPNGSEQILTLKYNRKKNKFFLQSTPKGIEIPNAEDGFTMPAGYQPGEKSRHNYWLGILIETLQDDVKTAEDLEKITLSAWDKIQKDESINIYAKAILIKNLLDLLEISSNFYTPVKDKTTQMIDDIALAYLDNWFQPDIEISNASAVKHLYSALRKTGLDDLKNCKLQNLEICQKALKRELLPGGIVLRNQGAYKVIFFKYESNHPRELWFYLPTQQENSSRQQYAWYMIRGNALKSDGTLSIPFLKLPHGGMFFVPKDDEDTAVLTGNFYKKSSGLIQWPQSWPMNVRP